MSVYAKGRPLIIGIGNPLRCDDGLGWAVAEQLVRDCHTGDLSSDIGDIDCDIHTVHQLTPELAQLMAVANLVVMIDASSEGEAGELRIRPLSLAAQPGAVGTHHATPQELAGLTTVIYGQCPPVVVISLTGADFSIGEHLSAIVAQRIPLVSATVRQCVLATLQSNFPERA